MPQTMPPPALRGFTPQPKGVYKSESKRTKPQIQIDLLHVSKFKMEFKSRKQLHDYYRKKVDDVIRRMEGFLEDYPETKVREERAELSTSIRSSSTAEAAHQLLLMHSLLEEPRNQ